MLVLTRGVGQTVRLGDNIEVMITALNSTEVKLSFDAPRDVDILRGELVGKPDTRKRTLLNTIES